MDGAAALSAAGLTGLSGSASAATPKKGGRFRIGAAGGGTTDTLDGGLVSDTVAQVINYQVRNNLVEILPNGQLGAELAESWEASPDAAVWTFELRKGVEFHNGKTLDAEDIVYTLNHHRGPDTTSVATGLTDPILDVKADGKYTVVITLKEGNADFAFGLSDYHFVIVPAGTTDWDAGIGTGGYILESFDPGVVATTRRNPNYWKEGRAHFDEIETITINDTVARTNALTTGEIDAMNRVELKTINFLEQNPDINIQNITGMKHFTLPMRTDTPPFDNNHLRLALKYAIDRQRILDTILRGYGTLGNDHPIAPVNRYHGSELPQREYDPDKAKFHMKEAGMEGVGIELVTSDAAFQGAVDATVLFQESASKAGIKINLNRVPADGYWSNVWLTVPFCVSYWSGRPTEDFIFTLGYAKDAKWNATYWDDDRFNELLIAARGELDEAKRREMYVEMQLRLRDEGGVIIPIFMNHIYATAKGVQTADQQAGNFELDGNRCCERWWFA